MDKTVPDFDLFAESYEKELNCALPPGAGEGAKYTRIKASHLKHQLTATFGRHARPALLDAGCGIGITDEFLKTFFPSLAGFDISAESIHLAKQRNPEVRYKTSDGKIFPFEDGEFDVVFAICVLHHILPDHRDGFLREAWRVLRPGGLVFLYEHNPWNPMTRFVVSRCVYDRDALLLSPMECRRLLRQNRFTPVAGGSLIFLPLEMRVWQIWEQKWLSGIPCGAQYFQTGKKLGKEGVKI